MNKQRLQKLAGVVLTEAKYIGASVPMYFVVCDPNWKTRRNHWDETADGPFLFFDQGVHHSSGRGISRRNSGIFETPEQAKQAIQKWKKYYTKTNTKRFKYVEPGEIESDLAILDDARVGVVQLQVL